MNRHNYRQRCRNYNALSRSTSRLIETAFVSSAGNSAEDLDEVDRLANHPVLRSVPVGGQGAGAAGGSNRDLYNLRRRDQQIGRLRKSRYGECK